MTIKQNILNQSSELVSQDEFEKRLKTLESCIDMLSHEQRDFLKQVNGRAATLEDLAEGLGKTGPAVRKQASRLYATLRSCIVNKLNTEGI